uniref:Uncharacterized protein n=1 Tax=Candidatus Kentrum sp. FW TaxID=2126338 RepID=A0A450TPB0_9GAMM|nr:MAG: hypothetical protein BECKFW1821B_GA0114236_11717 [Candidatus Kentron sp. FW]
MADKRVAITFGLGALVFLITRDPTRMASAFLVDFSCTIKLSTPVVFKAAIRHRKNKGSKGPECKPRPTPCRSWREALTCLRQDGGEYSSRARMPSSNWQMPTPAYSGEIDHRFRDKTDHPDR